MSVACVTLVLKHRIRSQGRHMTNYRITNDDLEWWLAKAAELEWTWAKTYAETAPHSYIVASRTKGMTAEDYVRAGRVIHTFGQPAKFYTRTEIYLTSPDGRLKWWTMDRDVRDTALINQATTDRLYGAQNAPSTWSGRTTEYDEIATEYDRLHPTSLELEASLRAAFAGLSGKYPPSVLDIGCGTGRLLDLGLVRPDRYVGVDPSTPMLNQLVRKHPALASVHGLTCEEAAESQPFTNGQFEIVCCGIEHDSDDSSQHDVIARWASRGVVCLSDGSVHGERPSK